MICLAGKQTIFSEHRQRSALDLHEIEYGALLVRCNQYEIGHELLAELLLGNDLCRWMDDERILFDEYLKLLFHGIRVGKQMFKLSRPCLQLVDHGIWCKSLGQRLRRQRPPQKRQLIINNGALDGRKAMLVTIPHV